MASPRLLDSIDLPGGLDQLDHQQIEQLAREVRSEIIRTVARNGGHLAPSLGVVELTIALHRVLKCPRDKIIWDVGHQSYAHKILTGRLDRFDTLRKYGGLSGFPRRDESPFDAFNTGHSSTSISAALGMAIARDLAGERYTVVAVIGDGSLTGGMAFEALNHAGHLGRDLIVILNDNEMSISRNVGALAAYLSRIRMHPGVRKVKGDVERLVERLPAVGDKLSIAVKRVKGSIKYLVVPGMLFEELGFTYLGPIDGHDEALLERTIRDARDKGGPVLIHIVTQKGRGYGPSEENPRIFHGVGPFDVESGTLKSKDGPWFTDFFRDAMVELGQDDSRIVAITAAMPDGTGLSEFARRFPERFIDVGIAEQHAVTLACGLASQGFIPVVAIYSTFLQRAYDQIIHDLALQHLHVVLAIDRAGLAGEDGPTHHGAFDISYLRAVPGMVVLAPKDGEELREMLRWAILSEGPVAIRYPRDAARPVLTTRVGMKPGFGLPKAEVLREGKDVTLVALGSMVNLALDCARTLSRYNVSATVINSRAAKPIDIETIGRFATGSAMVATLEENTLTGGFGEGVTQGLHDAGLGDIPVVRFGLPDRFVEHGPRSLLLQRCGLSQDNIVKSILSQLGSRVAGRAEDDRKWT
ncbi:MAG TPA: 1-deoxy-D-xylulose-5-phosphate synthase [Firmicutes bacterium]|nr:1-deoxy-D-xylulose-5-phosphate synthase [Bacillota bacterium]